MAERNVILDGPVKFRLKKKWKSRWCILKKLSPVADRLHISLYKDAHNCRDGHEKANIPLEDFFGVECGITLEKESHVMAILCRKQVLFLAFPTRESLRLWESTIRTELGEDRQFPVCLVKGPKEARLPLGEVKLCIQGQNLCIVTHGRSPPEVLSSWHVTDLRRFGVIEDKFCFEGGSQCGDKGAGLHVFLTEQGEEINRLLQLASQKRLSRANSSASCHRNVRVSQREASFRSCSAYLDWTHLYPDNLHLYADSNGLRGSQLDHNDTSSDETDADYCCDAKVQKLRSIDQWNRERLNTIYTTSSCPDCHSGYSHVGNISSLNVGGSTVEVTRSTARTSVSVTESTHSGQAQLSVGGYAGESKDSRSVASSDSDEVFTTVESDYYNILPPTVDYYNILPQQSGPCSFPTDSPASCSNFVSSAPRGETVHQSKPQNVVLRSVKSVAYRNKRNRIVHRSHTLPRTIHECRTDIYPPDSPGRVSYDASDSASNTTPVVDDTVDTLSEDLQAYRVSDYEHVRVCDAVSSVFVPPNTSSIQNDLDGSVKSMPIYNEDYRPNPTMALPSCRANASMASHAYGAARVCSNSDESPYMNLSVPQNKPRAPCGLQAQEAHNGEVRIDPLRPLEYIDLDRFDGVDEHYSCWLRGKSETPPPTLPPPPPPPFHVDAQERRNSVGRGNSAHGTPTRSMGGRVELPKKRLQKANRFLSFHGSLKRQTKSKSGSEKSLPDDGSCRRSHSMHSGKLPRCSSFGHTLARPGSIDCVNQASAAAFSVANSSSESSGLPPRPTRAPSMQSVSEYLTPSLSLSGGGHSYQSSSSQQNLCPSTRSDYMMMDPSAKTTVTVTSNTVFCTVDLPLKRTDSVGRRSRNASFSGNSGATGGGGKGAGYLEMAQVDTAKAVGRSMSMRESAGMSPPPLHHSKSWGDELESNYLQMNCSAAGDYIKMSPTDMDRLPPTETRLLKPFDNLLEHQHHLHRKPIATPRSQPFRDVIERLGSDSKPSSDEDSASKSNGKAPGLLSRLIRRNSSKKASRSQEDILTATAIETVPETCQMNTISHVRTKSADMLDDAPPRSTPERQRSMSYSDMSFSRYGLAEQKPRSLLFAVPPAPGAQSDAGLFVSVPPPVPPRASGTSLSGGRADTTYVTVAAVPSDAGEYFTVGPSVGAMSTTRHSEDVYVSTGFAPRVTSTAVSDPNTRCGENQTSRNTQPTQSQTVTQRTTQSTCPSRQVDLPRSGDDSPEADYLMVWADSPGKNSSGDSLVTLPPSRTSTTFDLPPRRNTEAYITAASKTDPIPIPTPQTRLNDDEHSCSSASPPALPEKTYRRTTHSRRGYLALPARRRTINVAEATSTDSPTHSCYSSDAESGCLPARTGAEKMKHIPSLRVSIPSLTIPREEEQEGIWMHRDIAPMQEEAVCSRSTANGTTTSYEGAETMSVMSHGSSDTPSSIRSDELKSCTSPASTTLRPRSGKEYQKLDRRKLAEDLNIPLEDVLAPKSPSVSSSVFTFDSAAVYSLRASPASAYSCGEDSPGMLTQRCGCVNRTDSLRSSETSPPGSCMSLGGNLDSNEEALLNYAEIDLSDSEGSRLPCRSGNEIEYAIIDMVATVTASRVGKEHAQLREDKLQQNVQRQDSGKEQRELVTRRVKEKRFSSMSSRDKKLSLTSIISSNSKGKKSSL